MAAAECVFVDPKSGDKQHIDICVYGKITYCGIYYAINGILILNMH